MSTWGICVGCNLNIEFDRNATHEEKPYPFWEGMWRAPTTGSTVCQGDEPYVKEFGYPARTYVMHDPVQQFLVTYHTTGGSMGEAITPENQWLVGSRKDAISLKLAVRSILVDLGVDEFMLQIIPLGIEVLEPEWNGEWTTALAPFKAWARENYGEVDE